MKLENLSELTIDDLNTRLTELKKQLEELHYRRFISPRVIRSKRIALWKEIMQIEDQLRSRTQFPKIRRTHNEQSIPKVRRVIVTPYRKKEQLIDKGKTKSKITFTSIISDKKIDIPLPKLTPTFLGKKIYPYLKAIDELQDVINEIELTPRREISIVSITQHSPVSVSLNDADGALKTLQEIIVPWRRKHGQRMAILAEQEKLIEIETKKAEVLEKRANAAVNRAEKAKIIAETEKQNLEIDKLRMENEMLQIKMNKARIELAIAIINVIFPYIDESKIPECIDRLIPILRVLGMNEFDFVITHNCLTPSL